MMMEEESGDRRIIHGVLMVVFGRGTLVRGASGTGKSELALEIISRGHRLVADDAVQISRRGSELIGESPELTAGIIALNGLGLVDVAAVFGNNALHGETKIELCIELEQGPVTDRRDLLSDARSVVEILDVSLPLFRLNVSARPANPIIIETAVRMLDFPAANAGRRLAAKHDSAIIHSSPIPQ